MPTGEGDNPVAASAQYPAIRRSGAARRAPFARWPGKASTRTGRIRHRTAPGRSAVPGHTTSFCLANLLRHQLLDRAFLLVPAQDYVGKFLQTFKDYPPSQKPDSWSIDKLTERYLKVN